MAVQQKTLVSDIGAMASLDPVALDRASYDLFLKHAGKRIEDFEHPQLDGELQLSYAESIGLGTQQYELIEVE
jgi:uncharacterized Fe-S center protein